MTPEETREEKKQIPPRIEEVTIMRTSYEELLEAYSNLHFYESQVRELEERLATIKTEREEKIKFFDDMHEGRVKFALQDVLCNLLKLIKEGK